MTLISGVAVKVTVQVSALALGRNSFWSDADWRFRLGASCLSWVLLLWDPGTG